MIGVRKISLLGSTLLGLAFLIPVGDGPWISFWREWTSAAAVLLMVLSALSQMRFEKKRVFTDFRSLPTFIFFLAVIPWFQWWAGIEFYRGDAILVSAYLLAFGLCIIVAQSMTLDERERLADRLAYAMVFAAVCSVPLAVLQWLSLLRLDLGMKVVAGRPVAHMEQTNLLCSLLVQGLFGLWRLNVRGRLGKFAFGALASMLLLTVDLTQSRVAWMVLAAAATAALWRRKQLRLQSCGPIFSVATVVVVGGAILVPWIDSQLGFSGLALMDRVGGGRRPDAWLVFMDATTIHPWSGWGALQNGAAQFGVSLVHPPLLWLFTSAHNIVLDLVVWFGVPIGLTAGATLIVTVFLRIKRAPDAASFVTALAATALLLHGLVELPLQYTYFLFPLGLMLGVEGRHKSASALNWHLPIQGAKNIIILAIGPALFLGIIARDYIPLSDERPIMAYDRAAHHASLGASAEVPDTILLDQLRAFHIYAAQQAVSGVRPDVTASLRKPMLRFTFASSQEHYAHIMALNGHPNEAIDVLQRSCTFMTSPQCDESRRAWKYWRSLGEPLPVWP